MPDHDKPNAAKGLSHCNWIKNPDMRKAVVQEEKQYQTNFYRLQKALLLKEEAKKLERDAGKK